MSDKKDGKQYLYLDGQKISDYYDRIYAFKASLAIVYNGPIQIINNKKVCKGGLYGIINITGAEILPCKYKSIRVLKEDRHYNVRDMNNKCYLINNNLVISDYYDWISKEGDGYLSVYKGTLELQKGVLVPKTDNGLRGVINSEGDVIIPLTNKYQLIGVFSRNRAVVKMNDKYGFINTEGRIIVPCEYSYVEDFNIFDHAYVEKNGMKSRIDKNGNLIAEWTRINRENDDDWYYTDSDFTNMYAEAINCDPMNSWNID